MHAIWLEDLTPGDALEVGSFSLSREEIIAFARQFDPQPFHLDDEAAKRSPFGGLIASGWHTASMCHRLVVDGLLGPASGSLGSPGVDELKWLAPVRPGDTLSLTVRVLEVTPSRSKPDRGAARFAYELKNQRGELVMTQVGLGLLARRSAQGAPRK